MKLLLNLELYFALFYAGMGLMEMYIGENYEYSLTVFWIIISTHRVLTELRKKGK